MKIDKISFCEAESEDLNKALSSLSPAAKEEADEAVCYYLSLDAELEYAFATVGECLLVRLFDYGRYCFVFPTPLSDGADIDTAIDECVRYAMLEDIEATFVGVPFEEVSVFLKLGYRHFNLDAESETAESYRVTLKNELMLCENIPVFSDGEIELSLVEEKDAPQYARLCRDKDCASLFGYNAEDDYPDATDMTFVEMTLRELEYASAMTYAIRVGGILVGDLAIHNFDYKGGADIAIRILPENRRRSYAKRALDLILNELSKIGLVRLYARVFNENAPSVALFEKRAQCKQKGDTVTVFAYNLV